MLKRGDERFLHYFRQQLYFESTKLRGVFFQNRKIAKGYLNLHHYLIFLFFSVSKKSTYFSQKLRFNSRRVTRQREQNIWAHRMQCVFYLTISLALLRKCAHANLLNISTTKRTAMSLLEGWLHCAGQFCQLPQYVSVEMNLKNFSLSSYNTLNWSDWSPLTFCFSFFSCLCLGHRVSCGFCLCACC